MAAIDEPARKKIKTRSSMDYFLIRQSANHIGGNKLLLFKRIIISYYSLEKPSDAIEEGFVSRWN